MNKIVAIILAALLITGCNSSTTSPVEIVLGQQFQLKYSASAHCTAGDFIITFKNLDADSRCPEGVECVWAGNAKITISVSGSDMSLNTNLEPKTVSYAGYLIELISVDPYPKASQQTKPEDYSITLVILKE